jgi:hypothetical protein
VAHLSGGFPSILSYREMGLVAHLSGGFLSILSYREMGWVAHLSGGFPSILSYREMAPLSLHKPPLTSPLPLRSVRGKPESERGAREFEFYQIQILPPPARFGKGVGGLGSFKKMAGPQTNPQCLNSEKMREKN